MTEVAEVAEVTLRGRQGKVFEPSSPAPPEHCAALRTECAGYLPKALSHQGTAGSLSHGSYSKCSSLTTSKPDSRSSGVQTCADNSGSLGVNEPKRPVHPRALCQPALPFSHRAPLAPNSRGERGGVVLKDRSHEAPAGTQAPPLSLDSNRRLDLGSVLT